MKLLSRIGCRLLGHVEESVRHDQWRHTPSYSMGPVRCIRCGAERQEYIQIDGGDGEYDTES